MKVLVVEDDVDLLDVMTYALRREGYEILGATDGLQALDRLRVDPPDIVLLDIRLPKLNGFEVCRRIRHTSEVPVIMVTARTEEHDVVRGLRMGADDYVTKPFSIKELTARMESVLRRCRSDQYRKAVSEVRAGNLVLSLQTHQATYGGEPVQLTPLEFRILYLLAMNEGQVIPYSRLVDYALGYEGGDANLLKTHICHIRQKLGFGVDEERGIRSLPTVGYSLVKQRGESAAKAAGPSDRDYADLDAARPSAARRRVAAS
jgi:DNA-binding response OmpR family regulator